MFLIDWIKRNKLSTLLLIIVFSFIFISFTKNFLRSSRLTQSRTLEQSFPAALDSNLGGPTAGVSRGISLPRPIDDYTPQPDVENRMVIQESDLSLLVEDVNKARETILNYTDQIGGYMVNSNISNPVDTPSAMIVIRIPADRLEESLTYFRNQSIKVVSENIYGKDVTDQYIDLDTRLSTLEQTKEKYESILSTATQVEDITKVTREIINIQSQIDSIKGQQESLEENSRLAKLTIYLSTDEIALPYTPDETFRPSVIFKLAVRSLISSLRDIASLAIWLGVYSVIWLPILVLIYIFRRRLKAQKLNK